jgi:hypothetical protein
MASSEMPVAMRNESRYPSVSAAATPVPVACAVRAAATVAKIASPTAAPTCWLVVNRAPARPWSRPCTPLVIAIDAVGSANPIPSAVNISPGSTPAP